MNAQLNAIEAVMTLGEKIKKLRSEKGISQEELGRLMDVHYTHVSRYERNQSTPSMEALKKLAKVFKVSADYLLFDDVEKMAMGDIHDSDLLHQFQELDQLDEDIRGKARFVLDAILTQQQVNRMATKPEIRR
jgi:transcriptional regulator with XRE-family HTH domain